MDIIQCAKNVYSVMETQGKTRKEEILDKPEGSVSLGSHLLHLQKKKKKVKAKASKIIFVDFSSINK